MDIQIIIPFEMAAILDQRVLSSVVGVIVNGKVMREKTDENSVLEADAISAVQDMFSGEVVNNTIPIPHNSVPRQITGKDVCKYRNSLGISRVEMAERMGFSKSTMWKVEVGGGVRERTARKVETYLRDAFGDCRFVA